MRQESKQERAANLARVQGYHEGGYARGVGAEAYAAMGYEEGFFFYASDRRHKIAEDGKTLESTGKPFKGYGLEIETECESITDSDVLANVYKYIIFPHFPANLFKMQHDGSLEGASSAECITQPMSKEAIRNSYAAFKAMYNEYFPAFGVSCSASGNCGMHVNISTACFGTTAEKQADAVRKLYYIINKHFDLFAAILNRRADRTNYCSRMPYAEARTLDLGNQYSSHHVCFNLGHYRAGRIELRIVGGQKNYAAFRNTMEVIFHLVDRVKVLSWSQLDDIAAIFRGCNQYVADRLNSHAYRAGLISGETMEDIENNVKPEALI